MKNYEFLAEALLASKGGYDGLAYAADYIDCPSEKECDKELYKWIPVEEKLPKIGELCVVIAQRSRWIADYGETWLPEEEKTDHPEWTFPSVAYFRGKNWDLYSPDDEAFYTTGEKGPDDWENLSTISERVIAWMPLPEPYRKEKKR